MRIRIIYTSKANRKAIVELELEDLTPADLEKKNEKGIEKIDDFAQAHAEEAFEDMIADIDTSDYDSYDYECFLDDIWDSMEYDWEVENE